MNNLLFLAYSPAHSSGWTDWIAYRALSAVIHALINGAVFKLMRQMTTGEAIVLAIIVVGALFVWSKSRDRGGMVTMANSPAPVFRNSDERDEHLAEADLLTRAAKKPRQQ